MIKHLYLHIPFCKRICPYCDFNKRVSSDKYFKLYRDKILNEIESYKNDLNDIETIYIGGGTPSFYPYIEDIFKKIDELIDIKKIKEYSIETTPESIENIIHLLKKYHINRVSIGIESFNKKTLNYLKRKNTNYDFLNNIMKSLAEINIKNINFDMIYSLPYETIDSIKEGLDIIYKLNPTHVSYYDLIIEDKTILNYDLKMKNIILPSEDTSIEMMDIIEKSLIEHGYQRYEISNYSKSGYESAHNLSYWNLENYLGIGSNSHSYVDGKRFHNSENLLEYINNNTISYYECNPKQEFIMMGLRKTSGISMSEYKLRFKGDIFKDYPSLLDNIKNKLLIIENDNLKFTNYGINLGNIVFEGLL